MPIKIKVNCYRTIVQPAMQYGTEYWTTIWKRAHKMSVREMRLLKWVCDKTLKDNSKLQLP